MRILVLVPHGPVTDRLTAIEAGELVPRASGLISIKEVIKC